MDKCSEPFGHEETLYEWVDVACIAHILESSISIADFAFLPILYVSIIIIDFPDG